MDENTVSARKTFVWQPPVSELAGSAGSAHTTLLDVYLHPGQNYLDVNPVMLRMILGSCAGVFLFDPILRIGGASHFMLPNHGEGAPSTRYGDVAIPELLERFRRQGSKPFNLQAKIFGGACMVQAFENLSGSRIGQIGRRNIEITLEILERESIPIVEKSVFGNQARKVSMNSNTGVTALEFVSNSDGNR
jgi:chemotaxis protein CheD